MDNPAGINAANESITAGGTPSGNLITSFFLTANAKISVEIMATWVMVVSEIVKNILVLLDM